MDEQEKTHNRPGDFALDEPPPLGAAEPVDVVQVRADDALIAALSAADDLQVDDPIDERLTGLLRAWREDVHAEPEPPIELSAAIAAMTAKPAPHLSRNPFGPLATAAALLVIAFVGLGLAAHGAEPGDALWGMTKVLYSDKAKSVEAKVTVTRKIDEARQALYSGQNEAALVALQQAKQQLPAVAPEDGKQQLETVTNQLMKQASTPAQTAPSTSQTSSTLPTTTTPAVPTSAPQAPVPASTTPSVTTPPPTTTTESTTVPPPTTSQAPAASAGSAGSAGSGPAAGATEGNPGPKAGDGSRSSGASDPSDGENGQSAGDSDPSSSH